MVALAGASVASAVRVSVIGPQDNFVHPPRTGNRAVAVDTVTSHHVADLFSRVRGAPLAREDKARLAVKDVFAPHLEPVLVDVTDSLGT